MNTYFKRLLSLFLMLIFVASNFSSFQVHAGNNIGVSSDINTFKQKELQYLDVYDNGEKLYGRNDVKLEWNSVEFQYSDGGIPATQYYVARRKINPENSNDTTGDFSWQLRGNYGVPEVKVLNVFPGTRQSSWNGSLGAEIDSNNLKEWIENVQNSFANITSNIDVTPVNIEDFNRNPDTYLFSDKDGIYNYDVVVFGFWDSNNYRDLSKIKNGNGFSSYDVIQDYINQGYGVIFGHDTIQHSGNNPNFTSMLTNNGDFIVSPSNKYYWRASNKIKVLKQSTANTFPYDITGHDLEIPFSHTVNQFPTDSSDIYMTFEKNYYDQNENAYYYQDIAGNKITGGETAVYNGQEYFVNAYLTIDNNIALIQTGHDNGASTLAEQAILANVIYSLAFKNIDTKSKDRILDEEKPNAPLPSLYPQDNSKLVFEATDNGSKYEYRVIAEPVGYGVSAVKNFDDIVEYLNNSPNESFIIENVNGTNMYAVSDLKTTIDVKSEVKGSIGNESDMATYEYYIDQNPYGEKRDVNSGTKFVNYADLHDIKSVFEGRQEGDYLHIWSYDNANNHSVGNFKNDVSSAVSQNGLKYNIENGITNIELWSSKPFYDVTVNFVDTNGNVLAQPETYSYLVGESFSSEPKAFSGYEYKTSNPENKTIVVTKPTLDPNVNTITHIYDEIFTNKIYTIKNDEFIQNRVGQKYELVKSEVGVSGTSYSVEPPLYDAYKFTGYISENATVYNGEMLPVETVYTNTINGNNNFYLHYIRKQGYPEILIQRENEDGSYTELARYTDNTNTALLTQSVTVLGSDILNHYNSMYNDIDAYINGDKLSVDTTVLIKNEDANIKTITLIPRHKKVKYVGINYLTHNITEILQRDFVYNGTNLTDEVYVSDVDLSKWVPFDSTVDITIDYTSPTNSIIVMNYYDIDGGLPEYYEYTYTSNYINELDSTALDTPANFQGTTTSPSALNFREFSNVNVDGVDQPVNFILSEINITATETGNVLNFQDDGSAVPISDIPLYLPELDENGYLVSSDYTLDIYYKPYTKVGYSEYLLVEYTDENGDLQEGFDEVNNEVIDTIYKETVTFSRHFNSDLYEVFKVEVDGVEVDAESFNFETISDNYTKDIKVYYRQRTYDLEVRYIDDFENKVVTTKTFEKVPISNTTTFNVPVNAGSNEEYSLQEVLAGTNTSQDYISSWTVGNDTISFNPNMTESNEAYVIDLIYKHKTLVTIKYVEMSRGNFDVREEYTKTVDTFLNSVHSYTVPDILSYDYEVAFAYSNGQRFDTDENSTYEVTIKNINPTIYVVYKPIAKYKIDLDTMPSGLGTFKGNVNEDGSPKLFAEKDITFSTAQIPEGYYVKEWIVTPSDLEYTDGKVFGENNSYYIAFKMPKGDVNAVAVLEQLVVPTYTLTTNVTPNGAGTVLGNNSVYNAGETVELTARAKDGYTFEKWIIDRPSIQVDSEHLTSKSVSFSMIPENVEVTAVFEKIDTEDDYDDDDDGFITNPNVPIEPTEPEPTEPEYPESIEDIVTDSKQKEIRKYIPYINGYENGEFRPDNTITRAEVIQTIYNLYGNNYKAEEEFANNFVDVDYDLWYGDAIAFADKYGIISGFEDGTFRPNEKVTRAQFANVISNLIVEEFENIQTEFSDIENHWAKDSIETIFAKGITLGYTDGTFRPNNLMTRAEFITMTNRLLERPNEYYTFETFTDVDNSHWAYNEIMNAKNGAIKPDEKDYTIE